MISLQEAFEILKKNAPVLGIEKIPLSLSVNRVLVSDILADNNFPPFNKSAVDGFACKRADIPGTLKVIETIMAGEPPVKKIEEGECAKIMTGAMVPAGADCVIMIEHTEETNTGNILVKEISDTDHICYEGEDKKIGEKVMSKGSVIYKKHIGILASAGIHSVDVYQQPNVTVFSTGTELVEPEDNLGKGQIRNSNGPQLLAQLYDMGINGIYGGIAEDDKAIMEIELARSIENFNGIIISGGVSAGDYDYIPEILKKMGFKILFHKLKVKPGKPVLFAMKGDKFCFGLPGNPVSSYVQFEILVKYYLLAMMGHEYKPVWLKLKMGEEIIRKKADLDSYIPVRLNKESEVVKVPYHGSGHVFALSDAFGLLRIPAGIEQIKEGEWGYVRQI